MEKVEEVWNTDKVVTKFSVTLDAQFTQNHGLITPGSHFTDLCGLGWRFEFSCNSSKKKANGKLISQVLKIYFDPYMLKGASFGSLSVSAQIGPEGGISVPDLDVHREDVRLDTPERQCVASHKYSSHKQPQVVLAVQVYFPEWMRVCQPTLNPSLPQPQHILSPPAVQPEARRILDISLNGEDVVDTKFILISHRGLLPFLTKHSSIFARRSLLQGHFEKLDLMISGHPLVDLDDIDLGHKSPKEEYDYEGDSDLESESGSFSDSNSIASTDIETDCRSIRSNRRSIRSKCHSIETDRRSIETDCGDILDVPETSAKSYVPFTPFTESIKLAEPVHPREAEPSRLAKRAGRMGQVVPISNTAFKTWRALVVYLYTRDIAFCSLRSKANSPPSKIFPAQNTSSTASSGSLYPCSPKSMYRLAEMLESDDLKTLALDAIRNRLSEHNIVEELFSKFTSRYPKIQEMEIEVLCGMYHIPQVLEAIELTIKDKLKDSSAGVLVSLLKRLRP